MGNKSLMMALCSVVALVPMSRGAHAAAIAFDTAGDSAYNSGQVEQINGGYGWGGAWIHSGGTLFSTGSGPNGSGAINSPPTPAGRAFRLTPGIQAPPFPLPSVPNYALRPFASALVPGQTFMADFQVGQIDPQDFNGYGMSVGGIFVSAEPHFSPDYVWSGAGEDSGLPLSEAGVHVEISVLNGSQAQISLTSSTPVKMYRRSFPFPLHSLPQDLTIRQQLVTRDRPTYTSITSQSRPSRPVARCYPARFHDRN
jgi:hypothetical protein